MLSTFENHLNLIRRAACTALKRQSGHREHQACMLVTSLCSPRSPALSSGSSSQQGPSLPTRSPPQISSIGGLTLQAHPQPRQIAFSAATAESPALVAQVQPGSQSRPQCLLCAPIVAPDAAQAHASIQEAGQAGADAVELRLDFWCDLKLQQPLEQLRAAFDACRQHGLKVVFTLRPAWEG